MQRSMLERAMEKVMPEPNSGCWLWLGSLSGSSHLGGYPDLWDGKRVRKAHRLLYTELVGEIPRGLDLDHKCRIRSCVNPAHMEPVTRSENNKRGTVGFNMKGQVQCPRGHAFTETNTYITKKG